MIKSSMDYSKVKSLIEGLRSARVLVTQSLGRNKYVSFSGVLSGVYPALFTVLPDQPTTTGKTSFSYAELLCGAVKVVAE